MNNNDNLTACSYQQAAVQVRQSFGFAQLPDRVLLSMEGSDALAFLQNRLSNDVNSLEIGQGQLNAILDRQGKIQGVFDLYRTQSGFWMLMDAVEKENAIAQIEKFRLMAQWTLQDVFSELFVDSSHTQQKENPTYTQPIFTIQGPLAEHFLTLLLNQPVNQKDGDVSPWKLPEQEYAWDRVELFGLACCVVRRSITGETGFLIWPDLQSDFSSQQVVHFWDAFKEAALSGIEVSEMGIEMSPETLEILRVEAALPRYGLDYDFNTLLPETGLERESVSYTKGCYLGQETIARVKTYGSLPRLLLGLRFEKDVTLPPAGSHCYGTEEIESQPQQKPLAEIRSGVFSPMLDCPIAFAYMGKEARIPGKKFIVKILEQNYTVEVVLPPFYEAVHLVQNDAKAQNDVSENVSKADILLKEGLALFAEGRDEQAIATLEQAIAQSPDCVAAHEALGMILSRHNRYQEAINLMETVLRLEPDHILAHTNLSVFYMKLGDKEKAEDEKAKATMAAFKKTMSQKVASKDNAGTTNLSPSVAMPSPEQLKEQAEKALLGKIAMFQDALKYNPTDPLGNFGLGSAYMSLKRYEEAIPCLENVVTHQPKHSMAYLALGKALEGIHQEDKAVDIYQKGIEIAALKGDLMPLKAMQERFEFLSGVSNSSF